MRMKRFLLVLSITLTSVMLFPASANASAIWNYAAGVMEYQDMEITISYAQGSLCVKGGEGLMLEVISLTGKKVFEQQVDSPAQKFELNIPKGCYIVKVGKVVRKVSIH